MRTYFQRIKFLAFILGSVVLAYADCRLLFYFFNKSNFPEIDFKQFLTVQWHGLPFDLVAILYTNILVILLFSLPINLLKYRSVSKSVKFIFLFTNSIALLSNCVDLVYFDFIHKRSTFDVFQLMFQQTDFVNLLPVFIKDFWYIFVLVGILTLALNWLYNHIYRYTQKQQLNHEEKLGKKEISLKTISFLAVVFFSIIGMRGGFQLIPIDLINAGDYVHPNSVPLVLNTPFSIMKSANSNVLEEKHYFNEQELKKIYNPIHFPEKENVFNPMNVVVIILESFSKEYTRLGGKKSYTPFLDSLMNYSLVFKNAYANGKRSIEGIPAILASIPSMQEAYVNSIYSNNFITSFANTLNKKGYKTSFYHGGNNGTMSFDSFCKKAGFDTYFGRSEYNNELEAEETWGIWDEPFLKKFGQDLGQMKQPFMASVFTLSSHHPFKIPKKYESIYKEEELPIHKCVRYTDNALRLFFNQIKKYPFYKNTLFVITADHTGPPGDDYAYSQVGSFEIPLLFFKSDHSLKGQDTIVTQQIDILPSVLGYLNYDKPFFSFGNNIFDTRANRFAINYHNQHYQYFNKGNFSEFDGNHIKNTYSIEKRGYIKNENPELKKQMEINIKALIQTYNNCMINNKIN